MSLNRSVPEQLPNQTTRAQPLGDTVVAKGGGASPDYDGLVRFLVEPFLESPESLRVDCEISQSLPKVWIRLAFEDPEKGRVFGRGGRNIQAIRTVLSAASMAAGHSIYLDIYGGQQGDREPSRDRERDYRPPYSRSSEGRPPRANPRTRAPGPKPPSRFRTREQGNWEK